MDTFDLWIADSPIAQQALYRRSRLPKSLDNPVLSLRAGWSAAILVNDAVALARLDAGQSVPLLPISFYHVAGHRLLSENHSLEEQGVRDCDVLVLLIEHPARVTDILPAQPFPENVSNIPETLQEFRLGQLHEIRRQPSVNNVTLNFSNGSSFSGPLNVGENIKVSYDAAASTERDKLRQGLEELVSLVIKMTEAIDTIDRKNDVSLQLKSFVEEAKKEKPSKWMLGVTSKGLLEAANTVASMAGPVTTAVKAVLALVDGQSAN